jgi:hypothetical protein
MTEKGGEHMTPVVFVNCSAAPFIDDIISGRKTVETRTRDTLGTLAGKRVLLAETGNGRPVVRASAVIGTAIPVRSAREWERLRSAHCVPGGSRYDWQPGSGVKYAYPLLNVRPFAAPFTPPEGVRHGRVWMEYTENEEG